MHRARDSTGNRARRRAISTDAGTRATADGACLREADRDARATHEAAASTSASTSRPMLAKAGDPAERRPDAGSGRLRGSRRSPPSPRGASITTRCCSTVPSANTAAEPKARITAMGAAYEGGRATPCGSGTVLDHASAAAAREEAERPADQHQQPVLEADQVPEVDHEPGDPGGKPAQANGVEVRDGPCPADRREVALVAVVERLVVPAPQTGLDELGGVAALLHGDRRDAREVLQRRRPRRAPAPCPRARAPRDGPAGSGRARPRPVRPDRPRPRSPLRGAWRATPR